MAGERTSIRIDRQPGQTVVRLVLRAFPAESEILAMHQQMMDALPQTGTVALDLAEVQIISSVFMGTLLRLQRDAAHQNRTVLLCKPSAEIMEFLRVLRLAEVFEVRQEVPDIPVRYPSAQEAAFLTSIREAPEDDTPRLIFADWLEDEAGQPLRAELIRAQCALARGAADEEALSGRVGELLTTYGKTWAGSLEGMVLSWSYRRGLIETVEISCRALRDHGDDLVRLAPVRQVRLRGRPEWDLLQRLRCLEQLEEIDFRSGGIGADRSAVTLQNLELPGRARVLVRRSQVTESTEKRLRERLGARLVIEG